MNIYDHPNLKEAFAIYARRQDALLPDEAALSGVTFSAEFEERMERLLARRRCGWYVLFGTAPRRVASVVAALLVSAALVTAGVEAIRTPVVQFFTEVFEKFTQIFVEDDTPALSEEIILEPHAPTYLPDGYVVESEESTSTVYRIIYIDTVTGDTLRFSQRLDDGRDLHLDTEDIQYTKITVGNYEGLKYTNKDKNGVVYTDGEYVYSVSASISHEELIKIAESLKKQ